jgi:Rod binding domain-containing protein
MNVQALNISGPATTGLAALKPSGDRFARELRAAESDAGGFDSEKAETLRTTAEQLVATTFIMPMLAKMREDPFKNDLFHGGQTEEIFGQRLDTVLAERIVSKANFPIVDAVYRSVVDRTMSASGKGVDAHG